MSQESQEPVVVEKSIYRDKLIFGVSILLAVSLLWFFYPSIKSTLQNMVNGEEVAVPFDVLSGNIYLTLAKSGTTLADLYEFNVGTQELTKTFPSDSSERIRLTAKLSPDSTKLAFLDTSIDPDSTFYYPSNEWFQMRVIDKATGEVSQITDTADPSKRLGDWSPDGTKIAYTAQVTDANFADVDKQDVFYDANQWVVFVVDVNSKEQKVIDRGTHPFWSPDGKKILYMKSDGLYLYDLSNDTKKIVLPTTESFDATTNIKIDVSGDGSLLALSIPEDRNMYLYKITSWESGIIEDRMTIEASGSSIFWPVFSPDSRYIAFQEADTRSGAGAASNARLSVFDLKANSYRELIKLDGFNFDVAFISDWK